MIFELNKSCFESGDSTNLLLSMANIVRKGRHRLFVPKDANDAHEKWLGGLGLDLEKEWRNSLDDSMLLEAREPAEQNAIVCNETPQCLEPGELVLSVQTAERIVREPFRIFVENDGADRCFFLTFSNEEQFLKIKELEGENLLVFEHCGGITELPKRVARYVNSRGYNCLNCSAMFDSDAPAPDALSRQAIFARSTCEDHNVPSFVLRRRAIENYIQIEWLNTWVNKVPRSARRGKLKLFNAYCRLAENQRSHFHMKNGLNADQRGIESGTISIYRDVPQDDLDILKDGFGTSLAEDIYFEDWVQNTFTTDDAEAWNEVNGVVNEILVLCR